jgi:hypothetical protein
MLEFTFWPTIEMTFLGLGSMRLFNCDCLDYYETSVVLDERLDVEYEVKSALERQKPTIQSWGSISICI